MIVSIPSGAIKSLIVAPKRVAEHVVSIPSGAIKRVMKQFKDKEFDRFNSFWCD